MALYNLNRAVCFEGSTAKEILVYFQDEFKKTFGFKLTDYKYNGMINKDGDEVILRKLAEKMEGDWYLEYQYKGNGTSWFMLFRIDPQPGQRATLELYTKYFNETESFSLPQGSDVDTIGINLAYFMGILLSNDLFRVDETNKDFAKKLREWFPEGHPVIQAMAETIVS